jgi:hypothetical protein
VQKTPTNRSQVWLLMRTFIHPARPEQPKGQPVLPRDQLVRTGRADCIKNSRRKKGPTSHTSIVLLSASGRENGTGAGLQGNGSVIDHHPPARSLVIPPVLLKTA